MRWMVILLMSPSALLKAASQLSMAWGNPWWVRPITNVRQLMDRIDKYKRVEEDQLQGKGKEKVILKRRGISGRTDITIATQWEISQDNTDQPIRKRLSPYLENRYIRFWRKSRMSCSSSGRIRWLEIRWSTIRVYIVSTTRTTDILQKTVGTFGTTSISWSEKGNWGTFCILLVVIKARQTKSPKEILLKTTYRNDKRNLCHFGKDGLMPF